MAIIVPTGYSTFGDSTKTEGPVQKYVLAQFRSDAELSWVGYLRSALGNDEVKYKHLRDRRPNLRQNRDLWAQVERGVFAATLVITDPDPVMNTVRAALVAEGAVEGQDFDEADVSNRSAAAIVAGTPVAYLPDELMRALGWRQLPPVTNLESFTPESIRARVGQSLRHAAIFAARAHATFDCAAQDQSLVATVEVFRSPLSNLIFAELLSTRRVFDTEHAPSAAVLNDASDEIANALTAQSSRWTVAAAPLVSEADSHAIDHLQAADVAAGWAREMLETNDAVALADRFERVWLNGRLLRRRST